VKNVWGAPKPQPEPTPANVEPYGSQMQSQPEPSYTPSVPEPEPQKEVYTPTEREEDPPEPTEKELAAAALFGGIPGATSGGSLSRKQSGTRRAPSGSVSSVRSTSNNAGRRTSTQSQRTNSRAAPQRAPAPTPAPAPAPAPSNDLLDLMGDWGAPAPAPAAQNFNTPAPAPAPTPSTSSIDPFAMQDLSSQMPSLASSSPGQRTFEVGPPAQGGFIFDGASVNPLVIPTREFGKLWQEHKAEVKLSVPQASVRTLTELSNRLSSVLMLHPVEAIPRTNEVIAAGKLGASTTNIFVHAKLRSSGNIDLKCRAAAPALSEQFMSHMQSVWT